MPGPTPSTSSSPVASWLLAVICALVVGLYAAIACTRDSELANRTAADAYYNLLVSGFRAGQLSLKLEAPAGLAALADPYDPATNVPYRGPVYVGTERLHDLTYFRGRLYLYFGVTPAVLLFWPVAAATGHYVSHQEAVTLFAALGFLLSVWLLRAAWCRYFPGGSPWLVAGGAVALGLANGFPIVLNRPDVWEVPIFCGYALVMLTLVLLWHAVHAPGSRVRSLACASLAFGLAVGARPSLLFGAVVLLGPVLLGWRTNGPARGRLLLAAVGPIAAVGAGLMIYNQLRFGSPFEFGQTYQLAGERQDRAHFGLEHLWFNVRAYFLAPSGWGGGFPFVQPPVLPVPPAGHGGVDSPFGALVLMPFTWLALALPFAWRGFAGPVQRELAPVLAAPVILFLSSALVLGCFYGTCGRYEVEFVPMLVLLAAIGALALDRRLADRGVWRRVAHGAVGAVLLYSVAGNLLAGTRVRAEMLTFEGAVLGASDRVADAVRVLEEAVALKPGLPKAQMELALVYALAGRDADASARVAEVVRRNPADAELFVANYQGRLLELGRRQDLRLLLEVALRQNPGSDMLQASLGVALGGLNRLDEALPHFQEAVRLAPANVGHLVNLGIVLAQLGRLSEARSVLQRALQLNPDLADVRAILAQLQQPQPAADRTPTFLRRP